MTKLFECGGRTKTMTPSEWESARYNWPALLMFVITGAVAVTIVPWYGFSHGYHAGAWIWFAVLLSVNELSITCGYHRLFAHDITRRVRRSSCFICFLAAWPFR